MISVNSPAWRSSVKLLRILCPLGVIAGIANSIFAWELNNTISLAISASCAGVNLILSWIQWRVFKL